MAAIGRVTATEKNPTSCNTVRFWVHDRAVIRPFDIVKIGHRIPGRRESSTYAIVQDLQYITDSAGHLANYVSSDFGSLDVEPQNGRLGTTIAQAEILYNTDEIEMPVRDGAIVEWADAEGIRDALGLRGFRQPVPAGYLRMSNDLDVPVELESSYLLGPEGAHLNIAGISGLATKTSYAMFLLNSIQQRLGDQATIIVFNVKGNDLLQIDEPAQDLSEADKDEWKRCGLEPTPFQNVTYLYPYGHQEDRGFTISHADGAAVSRQQDAGRAFNYFYDVETGVRRLALLFSDIDDPNCTMESVAHQLREDSFATWDAFRHHTKQRTQRGSERVGEIPVQSWRRFNRLIETRTHYDLFTEASMQQRKRQVLVADAIRKLKPGSVLVVDVEPLPDYLQCLVFGDVVQTIYGAKLGDDEEIEPGSLGTVVIFADELNKYAPRASDNRRSLTQNLLEITERGRSLGVVLFGAEQFRSGVHERVLGNCSTNAFGRTSPVEIAKSQEYRHFPEAFRSTVARLPQGHLLLEHAVFKTALIKVRFPKPCYYQPKAGGR